MWEAIGKVLTDSNGGANAAIILIIAVLAIGLFALLGKHGLIAVRTQNFSLGGANMEREIIRHQIEVAHGEVLLMGEEMGMADDFHTKYVLERVYDKVVEWIVFNHISNTPIYVESKCAAVYNLLMSLNYAKEVPAAELRKRIRDWVKNIIAQLVQTRDYYTNRR